MGWRALVLTGGLAVATAAVAAADVVEVTGYQVNLRERPSKQSPVIVTLSRGERFEYLGTSGAWYHVRMPSTGRSGYVHRSLVLRLPGSLLEPPPAPRAAAPAPAPTPPPAVAPAPPAPTPRAAAPPPPAPAPVPRQTYTPPPPPPPGETTTNMIEPDERRFDVGLQAGVRWLTGVPKSAKALFDGEDSDLEFGGFASYAVTRNVFLSVSGTYFEKEGQRVFLADADSPWFPLGHPLKVRLIPVNLVVGYRFHPWPSVVPYLAVGGGVTFFDEESTVGGVTESSSSTEGTAIVMGGVDYVKANLLFGVQGSWSTVPDSVGLGGVSAVYGEDDLGGVTVSVRLGIRF